MALPEAVQRIRHMFRGKPRDPEVTDAVNESRERLIRNAKLRSEIEAIALELKRRDKSGGSVSGRSSTAPRH